MILMVNYFYLSHHFSQSLSLSMGIRISRSKSGKILKNRKHNPEKILEKWPIYLLIMTLDFGHL